MHRLHQTSPSMLSALLGPWPFIRLSNRLMLFVINVFSNCFKVYSDETSVEVTSHSLNFFVSRRINALITFPLLPSPHHLLPKFVRALIKSLHLPIFIGIWKCLSQVRDIVVLTVGSRIMLPKRLLVSQELSYNILVILAHLAFFLPFGFAALFLH